MSGLEAGRPHGRTPGIHLVFGGNAGMHEVRYIQLRLRPESMGGGEGEETNEPVG